MWIKRYNFFKLSRDSSVGIALSYGLDYRGSRVRFPAGAGNFSLHHRVQNGSGAHTASYPMGTRVSFHEGKAAGAWSWPFTPSSAEVEEWLELYLHSQIRLHGVVLSYKNGTRTPLPYLTLPYLTLPYLDLPLFISSICVVWLWSPSNDFTAIIPIYLTVYWGRGNHFRSTPLQKLWTYPNDAATVGKIFGTPVVEELSVPSSHFFDGLNIPKSSSF
jgi:hypothetical protein